MAGREGGGDSYKSPAVLRYWSSPVTYWRRELCGVLLQTHSIAYITVHPSILSCSDWDVPTDTESVRGAPASARAHHRAVTEQSQARGALSSFFSSGRRVRIEKQMQHRAPELPLKPRHVFRPLRALVCVSDTSWRPCWCAPPSWSSWAWPCWRGSCGDDTVRRLLFPSECEIRAES